MIRTQRQLIGQEFSTFGLTVGVTAIQVSASLGISSLISTIVFSVFTGQAQSVFLGADAGVTVTTGLELPPGSPQEYVVLNDRELVELESPLLDISTVLQCRRAIADNVPFVVWDVTRMYLIAAANTTMSVGVFKEMWI